MADADLKDFYNKGGPFFNSKTIKDSHVCAGASLAKMLLNSRTSKQLSSCGHGDSGGPLWFYHEKRKSIVQVGIVSFGPYGYPIGQEGLGAYTRVSKYRQFILEAAAEYEQNDITFCSVGNCAYSRH